MDKFYLVWNPKGHSPTVQHSTYPEAEAEAVRLAEKERESLPVFHILESVATVKIEVVYEYVIKQVTEPPPLERKRTENKIPSCLNYCPHCDR